MDVEFYGISFGLDHLRGNKYINRILVGCSDIVSCCLVSPLADWAGRRKALFTTSVLLAVSALLYNFLGDYNGLSYALIVLTRMGAAASFALVFLVAQ